MSRLSVLGLALRSTSMAARLTSASCHRTLSTWQKRHCFSTLGQASPIFSSISGIQPVLRSATLISSTPKSLVVRQAHTVASPLPASSGKHSRRSRRRQQRRRQILILLAVYLGISIAAYHLHAPSRHLFLALTRCARLMKAVVLDVIDYKRTFAMSYDLEAVGEVGETERERRRQDRKKCHKRSAERMLEALKKNSGIYVKLGQHVASVQLLPQEWTSTMRPLQDQCFPTPLRDTDAMLKEDFGQGLDDLFTDFEPEPIGVASLAQVHRATDKRTGKRVAVKVQHADLKEFAQIDIKTVNFAIKLVTYVFPDFEFSWLGEEMNHMLPLEMDFKHEAYNSARCASDFAPLRGKTSLYLPEVLWAEERCLVMEYIRGARVDDLAYLKEHNIDRNQVALELSRIFSQMVYLNGYFHADPHQGNILIRPKAPNSASPFNFDCVLLDHGQYFDVPEDLRVNYARLWLALIAPSSPKTNLERRKYAKLVGNIDDDLYPILESAITGRMGMADSDPTASDNPSIKRAKSLLDSGMGDKEMQMLRQAMVEKEGLITSVFDLLRRVPRRLLMILKLNDLTRSLDASLATTHGQSRVFIVVARYCAEAAWQDDRVQLAKEAFSMRKIGEYLACWWKYQYMSTGLQLVELGLDTRAKFVKLAFWLKGLRERGWQGAADAAAGLA